MKYISGKNRTPWTHDEDQLLIDLLNQPWEVISTKLGRSVEGCKQRTFKLKKDPKILANYKNTAHITKKKHIQWSDQEREFMYENYDIMKISELEKALGRSRNSIIGFANYMGLRKKGYRHWTMSELNYLKLNFSKKSIYELMKELSRTKSAIIHFAYSNGLKKSINNSSY